MLKVATLAFVVYSASAQSNTVFNAARIRYDLFAPQLAPGSLGAISFFQPEDLVRTATVAFRAANSEVPVSATVVSVTGNQIVFQVPPSLVPGQYQVIYRADGTDTAWTTAEIVRSAFAVSVDGQGGVSAQGASLTHPAKANDVLTLWGSGLGNATGVKVTLGGVAQTVLYAGPAPTILGADQINFRVNPATPDGCFVRLEVSGAGNSDLFLSKSADGEPCRNPPGITAEELAAVENGAYVDGLQVDLSSEFEAATPALGARLETASAAVGNFNRTGLASLLAEPLLSGCA